MIKFNVIRWKNFLSYGNNFTEIVLDRDHTTILVGDSGAGKSTLLDAISFALFNKPFRDVSKKKLVNSINGKQCVVEIEFTIGKTEYKINRGISPNCFEIYKNGQLINQEASSKDYQLHLEKDILGFNIKSFKQIVVLGASGFTPFMELKPQDRRVIIEELLDIQVFSTMNILLKQKMNLAKTEFDSVNYNIDLIKEKIKLHEKYLEDVKQDKQDTIQLNRDKIEKEQNQIQRIQDEIAKLEDDINDKKQKLVDKETIEDALHASKIEKRKISNLVADINERMEFIVANEECPTCYREITDDFKETFLTDRKEKVEEHESNIDTINKALLALNKQMDTIEEIESDIANIQTSITRKNGTINVSKKYIAKIAKEIIKLKGDKDNSDDYSVELEELEKDLSDNENNKEKLIGERSVQDLAYNLLRDSGIKSKIIKQYIPLINKCTNKFLTHMDFFVTFNIDEEFKESIKSRGRDDFTYESFSEGEKQRIDLALLFTWRTIAKMKNSINTNLLIMDEVFDSYLDNDATENVINLLNSNMFKKSNIFVISHKGTILDKFDQVIRFEKKKNFSRIKP
jgi:DNA repair exonuclease SbcCD ATPase subunit